MTTNTNGTSSNRALPRTLGDIVDEYTVCKSLGEGAHGCVKLAKCKNTKKIVALKIIPKTRSALDELTITEKVQGNPYICPLYDSFETANSLVLVLEAANTDLFSVLQTEEMIHSMANVKRLMIQLLEGLAYCHAKGVAHRDIKPENILLDSANQDLCNIKICDFGLSCRLDRKRHSCCGSTQYCAPEVLECGIDGYDPAKADVWSAGIVLYSMATSFHPWSSCAASTDVVYERYCTKPQDFWDWTEAHSEHVMSPEFVSLFSSMAHTDPAKRLSAAKALSHPFFKTN